MREAGVTSCNDLWIIVVAGWVCVIPAGLCLFFASSLLKRIEVLHQQEARILRIRFRREE